MHRFFVNIICFFLNFSRASHILFSFLIFVTNNLLVLNPLKKGFVRKLSQLMISFIEFFRLKFTCNDLPILLTYDFSISPLTYGDFLIAIFLARFLVYIPEKSTYIFLIVIPQSLSMNLNRFLFL